MQSHDNIGLMLQIAFALKPLAEIADQYDHRNTYRPDHPASITLHREGEATLTLQHCFNARALLKELMS